MFQQNKTRESAVFHFNSENPYISVVIPAFNEGDFIKKTLESLAKQDYQNFELIIVDNNSKDETALLAKDFGAKVFLELNQGVGYARDKGFRQAKGEIIATTDADTILPSNWLSQIVKVFQKNPNIVAFGGPFVFYSGPMLTRIMTRCFLPMLFIIDALCSRGWNIPGSNLAVSKKAFLEAGGFNVALKIGEDIDLCQRIKKFGKVKCNLRFCVKTSGRRFRFGLIHGLLATYVPFFISRIVHIKFFNRLTPIRTEVSFPYPLMASVLIVFIVSLIAYMFYLFIPPVSLAEKLELARQKIALAKSELEEKRLELKNSLLHFKDSYLKLFFPKKFRDEWLFSIS